MAMLLVRAMWRSTETETSQSPGPNSRRRRRMVTSYQVKAARRPSGGAWHTPLTLSAPGTQAVDSQVAMGGDGTTTVTWTRSVLQNGSFVGIDIQGVQRPPTGPWGAAQSLSNDVPGKGSQVAMDNRGHAVVVWLASDSNPDRTMVTTS